MESNEPTSAELVQPIDSPDFKRLLQEWAYAHVNPETGLCRVTCCDKEVPVTNTVVYRDEVVLSVTMADNGSLLCGLLVRYHVYCHECRAETERTRGAIAADVDAVVAAGVAADLAMIADPGEAENTPERSEGQTPERSEGQTPERSEGNCPRGAQNRPEEGPILPPGLD